MENEAAAELAALNGFEKKALRESFELKPGARLVVIGVQIGGFGALAVARPALWVVALVWVGIVALYPFSLRRTTAIAKPNIGFVIAMFGFLGLTLAVFLPLWTLNPWLAVAALAAPRLWKFLHRRRSAEA